MTVETIRLLLVDDHEVVREGLQRLFLREAGIEVVGAADSGEAALSLYRELEPDVTVLDLSMPGISGLETCRRVLRRYPDARLVAYSMHEQETFVARALDAGVRGYVAKRSASRVLVRAVRRVADGALFVSEEILATLGDTTGVASDDATAELSDREFEVLRLLANGYTVKQAATVLSLSAKAVHYHDARMRAKLGIESPLDLVRWGVRLGLVTL